MNKFIGVIIFIAAAAFLVYMLITGQVSIAWERIIIYALVVGGISLAGRIRAQNLKKQDEEYFRKHPERGAPCGKASIPRRRREMQAACPAPSRLYRVW